MPNDKPRPGPYDRPPAKPDRHPEVKSEYPKDFVTGAPGQPTINKNARKQLDEALKEQ